MATRVISLLRPARKEWVGAEPVELHRQILWPPHNFDQYGSEEKLTAWTYTAMTLEFSRGGSLVINASDVLDRCAFLALPRTWVPTADQSNTTKLRLENYNVLRDIEQGKDQGKGCTSVDQRVCSYPTWCRWIPPFTSSRRSTMYHLRLSTDDSLT